MTTFDTSSLTPAKRGTLERHLSALVRYEGVTMTNAELYARPEFVARAMRTKGNIRYALVDSDECMIYVPKVVFDSAILPLDKELHQGDV